MSIEAVFEQSDFLTLHCPQTLDNKEFVNKDLLKKMKPSAFLINTARGTLINEYDLAEALNNGVLAGAGLDVLSVEPPVADNPLLKAINCIITPHVAWISIEGRQRVMDVTAQNIIGFSNGKLLNQVI
jgi:glycerate dehydrogenase